MFEVKPAYPLAQLNEALKQARILGGSEKVPLLNVSLIPEAALQEMVTARLAHAAAYRMVGDSTIERSMTKTDDGQHGIEYRIELAVMPASVWRDVQRFLAVLVEEEARKGNVEAAP